MRMGNFTVIIAILSQVACLSLPAFARTRVREPGQERSETVKDQKASSRRHGLPENALEFGVGLTNIIPPAMGVTLGVMLSKKSSVALEFAGSNKIQLPTGPGAFISSQSAALDFRYFPYGGSFLLGFGLGIRQIQIGVDSIYLTMPQDDAAAAAGPEANAISWVADLNQTYANYRLGWLWRMTKTSGIRLEFGTTSAFRTSMTLDADTSDIVISNSDKEQLRKSRSDELNNLLVNKTLPLMALSMVWIFP